MKGRVLGVRWTRPRALAPMPDGAAEVNRTLDPVLTKDVLYLLSYSSRLKRLDVSIGGSKTQKPLRFGVAPLFTKLLSAKYYDLI